MTNPASLLGTLISGTARAGQEGSGETEREFLDTAVMTFSMRRAGFVPSAKGAAIPICPRDELPALEAGADLLSRCLDEREELVTEWCRTAAAHGWRAPDALSPRLLSLASRRMRQEIIPVLGERGRWLASLNPAWDGIFAGSNISWEDGTLEERTALLRSMEDPAERRRLVESTWKEDPAKARTTFVEVIAEAPSPDDEPFLEAALGNRSLEVRAAAAAGLAKLPGSRAAREIYALAAEFVTLSPDFALRLPEGDDARLERYGIGVVKQAATPEQRRGRLLRLLGLVHPSLLPSRSPDHAIRVIPSKGEGPSVLQAIASAAVAAGNRDWARAIVRSDRTDGPLRLAALALLPQDEREADARRTLRQDVAMYGTEMLGLGDLPWSHDFTREFLKEVGKLSKAYPSGFRDAAFRMDPFATLPTPPTEAWASTFDYWQRILELRREMRQTILRSPKP